MACLPIPLCNSAVNWNTQEAIKPGGRVSVLDPTAVVRKGMETIPGLCDIIRHEVVVAKKTHAQISQELQDSFPGQRGFSIRSIQRFCENHDIHSSSQLSELQIDMLVTSGLSKVRHE